MKRAVVLYGLSAIASVLYAGARIAGWAEHTSAIVGMARSPSSFLLGPMFVVLHLVAVVIVPILTIAATLDMLLVVWSRRRRATRVQPAVTRRS